RSWRNRRRLMSRAHPLMLRPRRCMWFGIPHRFITLITIAIRITADITILILLFRFHLGLETTTIMAAIITEAPTITEAAIMGAAITAAPTGAALPQATFMPVVLR